MFITQSTVYYCILKINITYIRNIKFYRVCKTRISKLGLYLKVSILGGKLKFTSWQEDFGPAGWEIQNKVTKLLVNIFQF